MPASFPQGNFIKFIKSSLKLGLSEPTFIMAGDTDDPTSVAKEAPIGSIYFREGTSEIYKKLDSDSSTNWELLGNIAGPASSTDEGIARFDGTSGKVLQNSNVTIDDSDVVSGATQLNVDNLRLDGNTVSSTDTNGDINLTPDGSGEVLLKADAVSALGAVTKQQHDEKITGPASSTDNAIVRFDSTTGKLAQDSSVTIDDSNVVSGATQLNVDNLRLDGNVISSTDTNGDINLTPDGTGEVLLKADGVASLAAVTKQQLDAAIGGVDVKEGVDAASTADLTLSGEQTIDGISLVTGDRILVKDQTDQTENGIYIVDSGAWSRSSDANTADELNGALVTVDQGTANANTGWYQIEELTTLGSDNVVFTQFFGAGTYTADGQGIELSGSTFSLELDGATLSKSASGLRVAALTANRAVQSDGSGNIEASTVTSTELGYVSGVTSAIQTQLDTKLDDFSSTTDNVLVRTDGTSGDAVQDTGIIVDDSNNMSNIATLQLQIGSAVDTIYDQDDMVADSASGLATQQSIKAYVDNQIDVSGSAGIPNDITAGGGISYTESALFQISFIQGSGGHVDITANPQVAAGSTVGHRLTLIGKNDSQTVTLEDGNGLSLNGTYVMGDDDILDLVWDGSVWVETSRSS